MTMIYCGTILLLGWGGVKEGGSRLSMRTDRAAPIACAMIESRIASRVGDCRIDLFIPQ